MSDPRLQQRGPSDPPDATGCGPMVTILAGIVLLLPGICSLGFMAAEGSRMFSETNDILLLWLVCFAFSAVGIMLIRAAWRRRNTNPDR
jgi:hypothetical protein